MPKVLPAIFSYDDMKSKWNQDNPDEPYTRRKDLEAGVNGDQPTEITAADAQTVVRALLNNNACRS